MPEAFTKPIISQPNTISSPRLTNTLAIEKSGIDIPVSQYKDINGVSYSNKYFESEGDLSQIEDYVFSQMRDRGLKDTVQSYEQIIKELFDKIGIEENQESEVKINKILKYFELSQRNKSKDERKREMIKRAKEAEAQKELKIKENLEKNYLKAREAKKEAEKSNKQYQEKLKSLEEKNEQVLRENRDYQQKINQLLKSHQERLEDIQYLKTISVYQKQKLENDIKNLQDNLQQSMERERSLIQKHNQLKSII